MEDVEAGSESEVAPALLALDSLNKFMVVGVGSDLRVYDLQKNCSVSLLDNYGSVLHKDSIRAIRFSPNGTIFVSAGDDKLVKLWETDSWRCISTVCSEKRVSAVAVSRDSLFVCFADKFGVVWVVGLDDYSRIGAPHSQKAVPLFAHYCSIITSLEFSPNGKFIVSSDRDFKIRVTLFPKKPLDGAHEIQSFCLGHTEFVSCLAFTCSEECPDGLLLSGGGDSTVRLWDITSGSLLDACNVVAEIGGSHANGSGDSYPAVVGLCSKPSSTVVAAAVENLPGILLLSCDFNTKRLSVTRVLSCGKSFFPTCLSGSPGSELLWMVAGVSGSPSLVRVRAASGFGKDMHLLSDDDVPGGKILLENLQRCVDVDDGTLCEASEAVARAMHNLLGRKQYCLDKREWRKKGRNDKKLKREDLP